MPITRLSLLRRLRWRNRIESSALAGAGTAAVVTAGGSEVFCFFFAGWALGCSRTLHDVRRSCFWCGDTVYPSSDGVEHGYCSIPVDTYLIPRLQKMERASDWFAFCFVHDFVMVLFVCQRQMLKKYMFSGNQEFHRQHVFAGNFWKFKGCHIH